MSFLDFEQRAASSSWLLDVGRYERRTALSEEEAVILRQLMQRIEAGKKQAQLRNVPQALDKLLEPLEAALKRTRANRAAHYLAVYLILRRVNACQTVYWIWSPDEWLDFFNTDSLLKHPGRQRLCGQHLIGAAYLLTGFTAFRQVRFFRSPAVLAARVFGRATLDGLAQQIHRELLTLGYSGTKQELKLKYPLGLATLLRGSAQLKDMTLDLLAAVRTECSIDTQQQATAQISYALCQMGILAQPLPGVRPKKPEPRQILKRDPLEGIPVQWASWCQRWLDTSPLKLTTRKGYYNVLLKIGRWLTVEHPDITSPEQWTRELAIAAVAAIASWQTGDWTVTPLTGPRGKPLSASTKASHLSVLKIFFQDCQEWEWLPRRFNPQLCFAVPPAIQALLKPAPRPIDEGVWARLLQAGLELTAEDLPPAHVYPLPMVRAVAITWLFAGLRADEIRRLRVGCIRWQSEGETCYLDVPPNKSGPAYTKPVDAVLGQAIEAWQAARPPTASILDTRTGETVQFLFSYRDSWLGVHYLNATLIPLLCRKAGVAREDSQGRITSHRARTTIATQLANARQPMSLLALQEWLGHRTVNATQHYVKLMPVKLAQAYQDAAYFARNVRMVEVLVDREAIRNGEAARGEPWKFYDVGDGYCTYDFFDQCPHRMACARCDFFRPKASAKAQLLEAQDNLLRLMQEIPLTDEEQAAVEEGVEAVERLCVRLADVPTPSGKTPRELAAQPSGLPGFIPLDSIGIRS